jgi:hypothetical protein
LSWLSFSTFFSPFSRSGLGDLLQLKWTEQLALKKD